MLKDYRDITIFPDSTTQTIEEFTWRAVDRQGLDAIGQYRLEINKDRETLEIIEAETIKASGQHIKVAAADIKIQEGVLNGQSSNPENQVTQITFPQIGVGDSIHLQYKIRHFKLDLPGGASGSHFFYDDYIRDDVKVTLHASPALRLQTDANKLTLVEDKSDSKERRIVWHYKNGDTVVPEQVSTNLWKQTAYVIWSTFPDWKAIADGYQQGASEKTVVTDQIRQLAAQLTEGKTTQREQARAIYDWVRSNIRYVASYVGNGGWVPHDTASILEKRYGDCKDHTALLGALLQARGIKESPVLIMSDYLTYTLPKVPVMGWFNHAINYLPDLDMYLDSTNDKAPFDVLPEADRDKPVLVTRNFQGIKTTTPVTDTTFKMKQRIRIKLAADGSAERVTEIESFNLAAVESRAFLDSIGKDKQQDWAKRHLTDSGYKGSAELVEIKSDDPTVTHYRYSEKISNFINQPEASTLGFGPGIRGSINYGGILNWFTEPERKSDFKCFAFGVDSKVEIELAPELAVLFLPKDVSIQEGDVHFDSRYTRKGNIYTASFDWGSRSKSSWCPPDQYAAIRKAMNQIDKAIGSRLLFMNKNEARSDFNSIH